MVRDKKDMFAVRILSPTKRLFSFTSKIQDAPVDAAVRRSMLRKKKTSFSNAQELFPSSVSKTKPLNRNILGFAAGAGLGTICIYGIMQKQSNHASIMDKHIMWPDYVRSRLRHTFTYLGASLAMTAGAAVAAYKSPNVMRILLASGSRPILKIVAGYAAVIGSGILVQSVPYDHPAKHICLALHAGVLGLMVSPLMLLGGPLISQAALYTAGLTGSLALVSACSPSHQFLNWSAPLSMGLGAVLISSIGSAFAGSTAGLLSSGLYSKIANKAESLPQFANYDPINESISVFLDILNIFTRIAMILAGGGNSRHGKQQSRANHGIGGRSRR
ncbi:hypothetical protein GJ496_000930 [Pomphorhynchus laevis]|nr:hypothetical protein GJ496_000930 [Pomphorhynchus laevis]